MTAPPSAPAGLTGVLRRGAAISAGAVVVVQVLSLVQTLVLARLLDPVEIGVFTAGTATTVFLFTVAEGGLRGALVQVDEAGLEQAANTALWASLAAGVGTGLLTLAAAPLLGAFFADPLAGEICAASAGAPLLQAVTAVPDAMLQRRFAFRRRLVTDPAVALGFVVPAVVLAALGAGPWSMVAGLYVSNLAFVVSTWLLAGWWPGAARPSWRVWREMAAFSFPLVVSGIAERARQLLEAALVGRWLGLGPLAFYRYGRRVADLPTRMVIEVGDYVLFPAFARIAGDRERLRSAFLRALRLLWLASVPIAGLLVAIGTPLVVVLLGEQWRGAGVVLETMAGWGPGTALVALSISVLKGAGHTRPVHVLTVSGLVLGVGLLAGLVPWLGLAGVGLTVSAERLTTGVLALAAVRRTVGRCGREIARLLGPPVLAGGVATAVVTALERGWAHSERSGTPIALGLLLGETVLLGVIYLGVLRVVAPGSVHEIGAALGAVRRRRSPSGTSRVVWVATSPATRGGIASYLATMASTALFTGGRVRCVASHVDGSAARRALTFAHAWVVLLGLLARGHVDVLHLHTASRGSFVRKALLLRTASLAGVATVLHVHGGGFAHWYDACPRPVRAAIRTTLRRADAVVALSDGWAERLTAVAPGARVVVVGNPVACAPAPTGPRPGPTRVVCAGRISRQKGTFDLLEAWAGLGADRGDARLVVVGDGAVDDARERAARPDLAGTVDVRGWVPPDQARALLGDADVLALPSWAEGQPMVVLEAMAAGLPVVATDVGGIPDLVTDGVTGRLVAPRDVVGLGAALRSVLADPAGRAAMGAAGRERVRAHHDPDRAAERLAALYEELLTARGRRGRSRV